LHLGSVVVVPFPDWYLITDGHQSVHVMCVAQHPLSHRLPPSHTTSQLSGVLASCLSLVEKRSKSRTRRVSRAVSMDAGSNDDSTFNDDMTSPRGLLTTATTTRSRAGSSARRKSERKTLRRGTSSDTLALDLNNAASADSHAGVPIVHGHAHGHMSISRIPSLDRDISTTSTTTSIVSNTPSSLDISCSLPTEWRSPLWLASYACALVAHVQHAAVPLAMGPASWLSASIDTLFTIGPSSLRHSPIRFRRIDHDRLAATTAPSMFALPIVSPRHAPAVTSSSPSLAPVPNSNGALPRSGSFGKRLKRRPNTLAVEDTTSSSSGMITEEPEGTIFSPVEVQRTTMSSSSTTTEDSASIATASTT
jgi:hypothetical protein